MKDFLEVSETVFEVFEISSMSDLPWPYRLKTDLKAQP